MNRLKKKIPAVLLLIILFALALRLYGINFDVPHPDDYITVQGAMHYGPAHAPLNRFGLYGLYVWPAFTMVYIQSVLFSLYFIVGKISGLFPDMESFRNLYLSDPSSFHLIGRIMSVLFGIGTVWVLYHLGKKLYNHKVGLIAALFLSASFMHSMHSQYIRPDISSTLFSVLAILYCLLILEKGDLKSYAAAGIVTGLATATKFTSAVLILPVFAAHIMAEGKALSSDQNKPKATEMIPSILIISGAVMMAISMVFIFNLFGLEGIRFSPHEALNQKVMVSLSLMIKALAAPGLFLIIAGVLCRRSTPIKNITVNLLSNRKLLYSIAAAFLSFMVFDPVFFLDIKNQIRILLTDANYGGKNVYFIDNESLGFLDNIWWYIKGPINWGAGLHIEIMSGLGLLLILTRKRKEDLLVLMFPLIFVLVLGAGKYKWERYAVTLMPFISLYAAYFFYFLMERVITHKMEENKRAMVTACLSIVLVVPNTYNILRYDYLLTHKDTRVIAKEWVGNNIAYGSKIGQDAYTCDLADEAYKITRKYSLSDVSLDYYVDNKFEYLIVSDTQYRRYMTYPLKYPENVKFYTSLFSEGKLIKEIKPQNNLWPGPDERFSKYHIHVSPTIKIYKIN